MNRKTMQQRAVAGVMLVCTLAGSACKKESAIAETEASGIASKGNATVSAIKSDFSLNWENRANGSTYTSGQAGTDFGNVSGWNDSRAYITNGKTANGLRATLLPNALSGAGGLISNTDLSDGSAYEMDYDVKFHSQFNWGRGGKVGFGFSVGEGNTGGDPGWDGNGGSLRLMWYSPDSNPNRVYFQPYLYYKDQPTEFGESFGRSYPSSGALVKGQWYHVHLYIKSNTGSSTNGHVQIVINGTIILDQDIRWTTNDAQRLIKGLTFHTFRGGSQEYWKVSTTDYVYYDNLVVNKIS
ncbi:polysaccharide lyase [Hufsiella ginkgonis]|uniref:Polysaccharide lyase 14 domain-containing protein n=1 Tax=Hufsiella ginkgonis TaxID=2695274 RepID=A0A7K1XUC7_9SPHI|nr:hypothetical protein [Hufsiella ginkgonis]MXV14369.1 hypothetical protein [Hufsiella ginkgonis]